MNNQEDWVDVPKSQNQQQCTKTTPVKKEEETSGVWVVYVVGAAVIGCFLAAVGLVISWFVGGDDVT